MYPMESEPVYPQTSLDSTASSEIQNHKLLTRNMVQRLVWGLWREADRDSCSLGELSSSGRPVGLTSQETKAKLVTPPLLPMAPSTGLINSQSPAQQTYGHVFVAAWFC